MKNRFFQISILMASLTLMPKSHGWALDLAFKGEVPFAKKLVLSDVVDMSRTDTQLIEKYGSLSLEVDSTENEILPAQILMVLGREGVDLAQIRLLETNPILLKQVQQNPLVPQIELAIRDFVALKLGNKKEDIRVELTDLPKNLPSQKDFYRLTAETLESQDLHQSIKKYGITFWSGANQKLVTHTVEARVDTENKVVVAKKALFVGSQVSAADFEVVSRLETTPDAVIDLSDLGQGSWTLKEPLVQGGVLKRSALNMSSHMQKGALVSLLIGDKRFQIRALGRVKEVLDNGASVLVENVDSKKEILGRPIGESEVQIVY